jgi:outer membrane protein OmpA-like peptidoglycan-associated protein
MRSIPTSLILFFLFLVPGLLRGQDALLSRAEKSYRNFSYAKAIETYELAFRKDASSIAHARQLADSYWNLRDTRNAERWYAVVASSSQAIPEDLYRYAELLRVSGQFEDSDLWMRRYARMVPADSRVVLKENAVEKIGQLLDGQGLTHKVIPVQFNSSHADIAPFVHRNTIMFASSRTDQFTSRHVHSWNDQPFLNLFSGKLDGEGNVTDIKPMTDGLNTQYHESNVIISNDGSELYFTRNNYSDGRKILSEDGVNNLQIYLRRYLPEGWSKEVAFPYNSPSYSVGHPALSKDGSRLFFTSDMPGGIGGKDLYMCIRNERGGWGEPQNLGLEINTEGDEMFPYVYENTLYFSSDGHLGLGGLDIFRCAMRPKGFGVVENVNAPVNSTADDFGICLNGTGEIGFFTSDRDGALGAENIFMFRMNSRPDEQRKMAGRVMDVADARPIPFLEVRLLDMDRREIARTITTATGHYEFKTPNVPAMVSARIAGGAHAELRPEEMEISHFADTELPDLYMNSVMDLPVNAILRDGNTNEWLEGVEVTVKDATDGSILFWGTTNEMGITQGQIPNRRFGDEMTIEVTFSKNGYFPKTIVDDFRILAFLDQALTGPEGTAMSPMSAGVDMAKAMNLRPIYFDYREHAIRADAALELDRVVEVMRKDALIRIDLRSHTDSRASTEYNDLLSQRRAESTRGYLIKQGIHPGRIIAKGYGERQPVNQCSEGVECSEEAHQMNRRTEFIILSCSSCDRVAGVAR